MRRTTPFIILVASSILLLHGARTEHAICHLTAQSIPHLQENYQLKDSCRSNFLPEMVFSPQTNKTRKDGTMKLLPGTLDTLMLEDRMIRRDESKSYDISSTAGLSSRRTVRFSSRSDVRCARVTSMKRDVEGRRQIERRTERRDQGRTNEYSSITERERHSNVHFNGGRERIYNRRAESETEVTKREAKRRDVRGRRIQTRFIERSRTDELGIAFQRTGRAIERRQRHEVHLSDRKRRVHGMLEERIVSHLIDRNTRRFARANTIVHRRQFNSDSESHPDNNTKERRRVSKISKRRDPSSLDRERKPNRGSGYMQEVRRLRKAALGSNRRARLMEGTQLRNTRMVDLSSNDRRVERSNIQSEERHVQQASTRRVTSERFRTTRVVVVDGGRRDSNRVDLKRDTRSEERRIFRNDNSIKNLEMGTREENRNIRSNRRTLSGSNTQTFKRRTETTTMERRERFNERTAFRQRRREIDDGRVAIRNRQQRRGSRRNIQMEIQFPKSRRARVTLESPRIMPLRHLHRNINMRVNEKETDCEQTGVTPLHTTMSRLHISVRREDAGRRIGIRGPQEKTRLANVQEGVLRSDERATSNRENVRHSGLSRTKGDNRGMFREGSAWTHALFGTEQIDLSLLSRSCILGIVGVFGLGLGRRDKQLD